MKKVLLSFILLCVLASSAFAGAAPEVYITKIGSTFVFTATLLDDVNGLLTGGTTTLRLYELQADGTLKSYDFSSNTFKTTALTTATASMTHRTGNNSTVSTGMWSAVLSTITGFTTNNVYLMEVQNSNSLPQIVSQMFQYGTVTSPAGGFFLVSGKVTITGNAYASVQ